MSGYQLARQYVLIRGNDKEIYTTAKLVKEADADSIRFKCDIAGKHNLNQPDLLNSIFSQITRAKEELHDPPRFSVYEIHTREDIEKKTYADWKCERGCYYQYFLAAVGSDGNLYLCDHNTMPGAIPLGNIIDESFQKVWESERRKYLTDGVRYTCQCTVCPPFGNRANFLLERIVELRKEYGVEFVSKGIKELR